MPSPSPSRPATVFPVCVSIAALPMGSVLGMSYSCEMTTCPQVPQSLGRQVLGEVSRWDDYHGKRHTPVPGRVRAALTPAFPSAPVFPGIPGRLKDTFLGGKCRGRKNTRARSASSGKRQVNSSPAPGRSPEGRVAFFDGRPELRKC